MKDMGTNKPAKIIISSMIPYPIKLSEEKLSTISSKLYIYEIRRKKNSQSQNKHMYTCGC